MPWYRAGLSFSASLASLAALAAPFDELPFVVAHLSFFHHLLRVFTSLSIQPTSGSDMHDTLVLCPCMSPGSSLVSSKKTNLVPSILKNCTSYLFEHGMN